MDRVGFEPTISPMPRAHLASLDDRPMKNISASNKILIFVYIAK